MDKEKDMWKVLLGALDSKAIATIITSVGGVVLAALAIWLMFEAQNKLAPVLTDNIRVVQANVGVIEKFGVILDAYGRQLDDNTEAIKKHSEIITSLRDYMYNRP